MLGIVIVLVLVAVAALFWFLGSNIPNAARLKEAAFYVLAVAVALLAWLGRDGL